MIPENATLEGQTQLTLRGVNLGNDTMEMVISVVFSDFNFPPIPCLILSTDFRPSRQVACRLEPRYYDFKIPSKLTARIILRLTKDDQLVATFILFLCNKILYLYYCHLW